MTVTVPVRDGDGIRLQSVDVPSFAEVLTLIEEWQHIRGLTRRDAHEALRLQQALDNVPVASLRQVAHAFSEAVLGAGERLDDEMGDEHGAAGSWGESMKPVIAWMVQR